MATESQNSHGFQEKNFSIEPDLGDQRQSTYKALPSPPKTPKRVLMKYRFSGVFSLILSLTTFVLTLVVVLAGRNVGTFEGQYIIALNTSRVGQDVVTFERASATSTPLSGTSSTSSRLPNPTKSVLTSPPSIPTNSDNSLEGIGDILGNLSGSLTDIINDGLGDVINGVVGGIIKQTGVRDFYYVYLQKICSGSFSSADGSNADAVRVDDCRSWDNITESIEVLSNSIPSSVVVGQTRISIPLLAKTASSLQSALNALGALRRSVFAFLIITLIGSGLSVISTLPAMYFPQSRLLIYFNIFWPALATIFAFAAALLLSAIVVVGGFVNGLTGTVGVQIKQGGVMLLFVWLGFVFVGLVKLYWASVWFVETRKSSFVKRRRDEDEIGQWSGIGRELWRDVRGRRRKPSMRGDI
ncbi:uncharacterized protein EKO05_0007434 [Ascochyta rabiei]|uniref:Uncharacterized protein n=1 Tax=Didymella rabiei TaxID=5454 RepID=A0A163HCJ6_DIDRA|nr:uncharacterized protein EKO05_0007434 [Ascochyta rabiei]KZM25238.1 hypothetical protein ST47_g3604 [Ascochyta rabiei]UPX17057.1 hypothetical protein EKO05_0007434 [Ascochyta rabiei]